MTIDRKRRTKENSIRDNKTLFEKKKTQNKI